MWRLSLAIGFCAFFASINAFKVLFNTADHYIGTNQGQYLGTIGDSSGCQTTYLNVNTSQTVTAPGGNYNAVINPEGADVNDGVAFWGLNDCSNTQVGFGNVKSCLGTGYWSSLEIMRIDDVVAKLTNLQPAAVQSLAINATATEVDGQNLALETATAAASSPGDSSPSQSPTTSAAPTSNSKARRYLASRGPHDLRKPIAYGSIQTHNKQSYKYQQLSANVYRGIPLAQWSPALHKRNTAPLPLARLARSTSISPRRRSPLQKKALLPGKCNMIRTCIIASPDDPNLTINSAGPSLLSALHALNLGGNDWQFLMQPFVVELLSPDAQTQGTIYAQTLDYSNVTTCSDQGSERDALEMSLVPGVDRTGVSDLRVDLKLGLSGVPGATNSLFVNTRSAGATAGVHPICEAIVIND